MADLSSQQKELIRQFSERHEIGQFHLSITQTRLLMQALFDHDSDEAAELHDELAMNMDLSRFGNASKPVVILFIED